MKKAEHCFGITNSTGDSERERLKDSHRVRAGTFDMVLGRITLGESIELHLLKQICQKATIAGAIDEGDVGKLSRAFGERFNRAWEAIEGQRVKKYVFKPSNRLVWIVVGKGRDYLIMPAADFCTCSDFYFRVMDEHAHLCYHLIAQKLAEALNRYDLYDEEDGLYNVLMKEWKKATA